MTQENTHILAGELRPLLTRLVRKLRKLSPADGLLSQNERAVLVLLDQNGQLLSGELAVMEKMTAQSMGQLLNRLSELQLIEKTVYVNDKRKVFISLSAQGKKMMENVRSERNEWLSKAISSVCTKEDQHALKAALAPLAKLVDFE